MRCLRPYLRRHSTAVRPFGSGGDLHPLSCKDSSQAVVSSWFPIGGDECRGRRTGGPVRSFVKLGKFRLYLERQIQFTRVTFVVPEAFCLERPQFLEPWKRG